MSGVADSIDYIRGPEGNTVVVVLYDKKDLRENPRNVLYVCYLISAVIWVTITIPLALMGVIFGIVYLVLKDKEPDNKIVQVGPILFFSGLAMSLVVIIVRGITVCRKGSRVMRYMHRP